MKISNLSGGLGLLDIMARHGAALVHEKPRVNRDPKMVKVNNSQAKEKSGTSTDKNQDSTKRVNKAHTVR
ncbi:MAG TPA: hypothetical protein VKF36_19275 [Syntrophorhabdales bacterium]|nr:hypothetical protein [Syntrophorhabdales bacterium]